MRLTKLALRVLAVAGLGVALAGQLGRVSVTADMVNAFLVPIGATLAIVAIAALALRDLITGGIASIGLVIAAAQFSGASLAAAPRTPTPDNVVRIVSLNAFHDNGDIQRLIATATHARPDILMVEEADGAAGAAILTLLPGFHRVTSCGAPPCSLIVFSRWPAARIVEPSRPGEALPDLLVARVRAPFGDINVVAVHLPRTNMPNSEPFRAMLVDTLLANGGMPLLLGGDFNQPTGSFGLSRFEALTGLKRAERWIPTYPANLPIPALAAIDHIYVSADWRVHECRRLPDAGSDHFGLACAVSPPR